MNRPFGPWATAACGGANVQLSTFWRRRLTRLPAASRSSLVLTRPAAALLVAVTLVMGGLPTLRGTAGSAPPGCAHLRAQSDSPSIPPAAQGQAGAARPGAGLERRRKALAALVRAAECVNFSTVGDHRHRCRSLEDLPGDDSLAWVDSIDLKTFCVKADVPSKTAR